MSNFAMLRTYGVAFRVPRQIFAMSTMPDTQVMLEVFLIDS